MGCSSPNSSSCCNQKVQKFSSFPITCFVCKLLPKWLYKKLKIIKFIITFKFIEKSKNVIIYIQIFNKWQNVSQIFLFLCHKFFYSLFIYLLFTYYLSVITVNVYYSTFSSARQLQLGHPVKFGYFTMHLKKAYLVKCGM